MAKGNDGGGDLELADRDRRDGAEGPGAHDVAQDAGLGAEVVPGRRGHGLSVLKGLRGRWGRLAPKLQGLAAGAAGRRGGGTLLRGFVWTRLDAADARIPSLSAFSRGTKGFCQGQGLGTWANLPSVCPVANAVPRDLYDAKRRPYDYTEPLGPRDPEEVAP